jgi:predicted permease
LRRDPGIASTAILTLGAAIGASLVAFTSVNALFLRPLSIREPDRLVVLWEEDLAQDRHLVEVSFRNFRDWRARSTSFESMAAMGFHDWGLVLLGGGEPERIPYRAVAASFFDTLGVEPLLGRAFVPDDDEPGAPRVVLLSHGLWQRRFGGDPRIIGRALPFETSRGEELFTVVGVMPKAFQFPAGSQLWAPAGREIAEIQTHQGLSDETMRWIGVFNVVGRLKPGVTREEAEAEMDAITGSLAAAIDRRHGAVVIPFADFLFGRTRTAVLAILAAVGLVALIACANVSNLLASGVLARRRSFAIRRALGASRASIARVLLAESLMLSFGGAALGVLMAVAAIDSILELAPAGIPQLSDAPIDASVLAFAILLAVTTGVLSSILPLAHIDSPGGRRLSAGGGLVVWQTALAAVVLVGAALSAKSFTRLLRADLGFEPAGVLSFGVSPSNVRYSNDLKRRDFYAELLRRLEALPDVEAAGAVLVRPYRLGAIGQDAFILAEGQSEEEGDRNPVVNWQVATPGYFRAMGIRLLEGRGFEPSDDEGTGPVAVIGESLARRFWPGESPLGQRLRTLGLATRSDSEPPWATVVGVVEDVRYRELHRSRLNLYLSYRQVVPLPDGLTFLVRSNAELSSLTGALTGALHALDPEEPLDGIDSMEEVVREAQAPWRFASVLLSSFAGLATTLTALGVFAVLSRSVSERRRELGVRLAIGARVNQIVRLVVGRALRWSLLGVAIGMPFARFASGYLESLLFEVEPTDPLVFSGIPVFVLAVGMVASFVPARRAAATDPAEALRAD